jgi:glycosyltransferase involved in cell wall biosynthesis
MKVLMISGDKNILIPGSDARARFELQRSQVEQLDVFVWPQVHSLRAIRAAVRSQHYDLITAQDPFWRGHLSWHFSRRNHTRLNIQVHTELAAEPWWRRAWAYFQLRHATSIRVVSQKLKQEIAPHVRAPISVLPVYINLARFTGLEHRPHPRFKKTILWVGRFEAEKNPLQALSILREVRASGVDAGLIMLGSGSLEHEIHTKAENFSSYVEFPGWQDSATYLPMADVVICTSRYESYGASIVEALAAGVPVVAPDVGIAKEAGATVVARSELATATLQALRSNERGVLKLQLPNAEEWAKRWKETLI